jgi:hypothetical protein
MARQTDLPEIAPAGMSPRTPMIAMTTSSSTSVKPTGSLPLRIAGEQTRSAD